LVLDNGGAGIHVYHSDNVTARNNTVFWNHRRPTVLSLASAGPCTLPTGTCTDTGTWRGELSMVYAHNSVFVNNLGLANTASNGAITAALEVGTSFAVVNVTSNTTYPAEPNFWRSNLTFTSSGISALSGPSMSTTSAASLRTDATSGPFACGATVANGNLLGVNPLFVAAGVPSFSAGNPGPLPDFHLQSLPVFSVNSPAIAAGTTLYGL